MARIALADDAAFVRLTLRQILEQAGHKIVAEAADGNEAFEVYKEYRPDIMILDITMPTASGTEGLRKIKAYDPNAKCIMCSAMGQQAHVVEAMTAGAMDFIVKPFKPYRIVESVENVLKR